MRIMRSINLLFLAIFLSIFCVSCITTNSSSHKHKRGVWSCASCSTTRQVKSVANSGFLTNYEQLTKGKNNEALMVYVNKDTKFNHYNKIIIKPVRLIASEGSDMAEVSKEDLQTIADYFYASLNQKLSPDYTIVKEPAPKTMELRVALTDMSGSKVVMDTLSSIIPFDTAINMISNVNTGNNIYVGAANAEMELVDATTGKRLIAAVDGRSGKKYTGKFDKWGKWTDTKDACDYWATRLSERLFTLVDADYLLYGGQ